MCNFEGDTVKSDCPRQENDEIFNGLIQTVGLFYLISSSVCSGDIKKKKEKEK